MKGKAAMMGATIVMVAAVAMVLSLVLVLLAELYCTLLLRKRRHTNTSSSTSSTFTTAAAANRQPAAATSLSSFYAQGVIRAPRSFLFPDAPSPENSDSEKQIFHNNLRYSSARMDYRETASPDSSATSGGADDQLIYICNPMYDGGEAVMDKIDTPFETPATSPSNFDIESGSGSGSGGSSPAISTPQLTPMKKLPAEGASVSLRDAGSICTTPSDSNTIFGGVSSSSSVSPSTSPSW